MVSTDAFESIQAYVRSLPAPRKESEAAGKGLMELLGESPSYQSYMSGQLEPLLGPPPAGR